MAVPVPPWAAQGPAESEGPWLVTTAEDLAALVEELVSVPRYALDTEFHRERTYWPRLALVQVAWEPAPGAAVAIALVDPLAVDLEPFAKVLAGPGVMVAHAASQDLEVLARACQLLPSSLFDTQVAAGLPRLRVGFAGLVGGPLPARAPGQGRPPHAIGAAVPLRPHSCPTPPRTSPTCSPLPT